MAAEICGKITLQISARILPTATSSALPKTLPPIIRTNVLTKLHEDWTINVTSRVLTRKFAPPTGGHVFQRTGTIFKLSITIIETNVLPKFHEDCTINMTSRVKIASSPGGHIFQQTGTIFKLVPIIRTNVLTKFHEDWNINKTCMPPIWALSSGNHSVNGPTDGRTDRRTDGPTDMCKTIYPLFFEGGHNKTSRVKTAPPPGGHVFQRIGIILELIRNIIRTNVLTKFHEDWTQNKTSRVLTRKTAPSPGGHFDEDLAIHVTSRVLTSVFFNLAYFELDQDIIRTNLLTKFHEDQTIDLAS
ncbi:hypothetical protein DPMN_171275 [Dreissena polymorpha]|uniref:Uncharacterized protein n=1 Tax=Dreissena polymorpha TaxID=45954 RepID=A0A9D4DYM2_DREPO|nr:hypothetical protein DPMN_171275 [Dreissena polymorpha]